MNAFIHTRTYKPQRAYVEKDEDLCAHTLLTYIIPMYVGRQKKPLAFTNYYLLRYTQFGCGKRPIN